MLLHLSNTIAPLRVGLDGKGRDLIYIDGHDSVGFEQCDALASIGSSIPTPLVLYLKPPNGTEQNQQQELTNHYLLDHYQ